MFYGKLALISLLLASAWPVQAQLWPSGEQSLPDFNQPGEEIFIPRLPTIKDKVGAVNKQRVMTNQAGRVLSRTVVKTVTVKTKKIKEAATTVLPYASPYVFTDTGSARDLFRSRWSEVSRLWSNLTTKIKVMQELVERFIPIYQSEWKEYYQELVRTKIAEFTKLYEQRRFDLQYLLDDGAIRIVDQASLEDKMSWLNDSERAYNNYDQSWLDINGLKEELNKQDKFFADR